MKSIDELMKLPFRMEIIPDADEGGFAVSFPELKGCLTYGDTVEKALLNAEEAKREWFNAAIEEGYPIPELSETDDYETLWLNLPRSLKKQLSEHARDEGISVDRYCLYLLTKNISNAPLLN